MKPTYEQLEQQLAAVVAENAALKAGPQGFFAYSSVAGYEEFATEKEAMEFAKDEISDFRDQAHCDGWSDEVGSVVWGVVMQRATMTGLRDITEEDCCAPDIEQICDYALLPLTEAPATDAFLVEEKAHGAELAGDYLKRYAQGLHEEARLVLQDAGELCNGVAAQLRQGAKS